MSRLLLVRHGQSELNAAGRWQGHCDSPLTELGREQARGLQLALGDVSEHLLVTSPLIRAVETAQIAFQRDPVLRLEGLRELDVGAWEGLSREQIRARWPSELERFDAGDDLDARPVGGESRRDVARRVGATLRDLLEREPGPVALVVHFGVGLALLPHRPLENAGWCRIDPEGLDLEALAGEGVAEPPPDPLVEFGPAPVMGRAGR